MRPIVDGVWEIAIGYVHAHVFAVDDGLVLVDTGLPGKVGRIDAGLRGIGRSLADVRAVLVTHRHPDHIGALGEITRRSGATVVAHEADEPVISGAEPQPVRNLFVRLTAPILGAPATAPVDRVLRGDGPTGVPGVTAIHTPGHTAGHVSYLLDRDGGVLFAGDVASSLRGRVRKPPRIVTEDMATNVVSMCRLAEFEFDTVVFGHGRTLVGGAARRFRDAAATLRP